MYIQKYLWMRTHLAADAGATVVAREPVKIATVIMARLISRLAVIELSPSGRTSQAKAQARP